MSSFNNLNVAPNGTEEGPSADNIPIVSGSPSTPVLVATINNGSTAIFYNVAAALLPQSTGASYTYRFTFNGYLSTATTSSAGSVSLLVFGVRPNTTTYQLISQTVPIATPYGYSSFSASCVWVPGSGDTLRILVENRSGATMTNVTLLPTLGSGIELVSTATTQQLIFS